MEAIKNMNAGEWVTIDHKFYSHIEIGHDLNGYTYGLRSRRSGRMTYPTAKVGDVKFWKTLDGAKKAAIKFLEG